MPKILEKLKKRWDVQHNWEILVILVVFALTGSSTVYFYGFIKEWIGILPETNFLVKSLAFLFLGLPVYNILLIIWGKIFGQGVFFQRFVREFTLKMFPFLRKK